MSHPVQRIITSLYAAKRCPRLHINAIHPGVECPDFVRKQWREKLVIDLDANYPLNLAYEKNSVAVDLSFGGHVSRCMFPWKSIYAISDRATGRGMMFETNLPDHLHEQAADAPLAKQKSALQAVDASSKGTSEQPSSDSAPETQDDEDKAKKRRAAFRVIDGGS